VLLGAIGVVDLFVAVVGATIDGESKIIVFG
jgi:hypothetical protein